jgi:phospholipid/cholesterol/gamma-HCH transport system ATP-binding protein
MNTIVAQADNLKKSFGTNDVLVDISLKLHQAENLVIFGKSGSGKSVLIKCLAGLITPDEGTILLFGEDIAALNDEALNKIRKRIGFLFQSAALYDSMTVAENLAFPLRDQTDKNRDELSQQVLEVLTSVGLEEALNKMPSELSGGMRKRVGLARSLMLRPEIILYDEPTTGLDPITSKEISQLILDVQKKYNTAAIIITHDVECARITANRMMAIKEGATAAEGTFQELENAADSWVKSFFK